ncbi:MAG: preprotein translocase subunit SecA [Spirochaetota bacterium]|nr:preprotein translocase subunit SecA [Spirochaetota bacterium]
MLDKTLSIFFGTKHERDIKKLRPYVEKINSLEPEMKKLSNAAMEAKTFEFRGRLERGESLDSILPEAFALVREASIRTLGMRHFDVQLMGGVVLHQGKIAEMKTGEGKTLVATLPFYLNALNGNGVHLITVNDYLARRDAEWMGPVYRFLGLLVGIIQHDMDPYERQEAYSCDVIYGTNNEFGFDYLRDNMIQHKRLQVQRDLNFAIVDEVDSILIDEARTPLIISGSTDESTKKYIQVNRVIPSLIEVEDYEINEKDRNALLTEQGVRHVEKLLKIDNLYDSRNIEIVHHINQALKAHTLFKRDVDYVVADGQVIIVDEFTGRLMPGRRYSDGLHQALEAKENVSIARESQTLASITFQNYFRMYKKLAGMTGTADTEAVEFKKIYNLDVVVIPTNEPVKRDDYPDKIYRTEKEKYNAIVEEIEELSSEGRPILVGTISIEKSEKLSHLLKMKGIHHNVLNAKYHEREAKIIAEAGSPGTVTIATNMAGRGTDIVLGGRKLYIDEVDNHMPVHEGEIWDDFKISVLNNEFDKADDISEKMTGQDKQKARDIIRQGREWVGNHQSVVDAGGVHILGTERHEARRIDNQLRGRSGRQGDPGSSRFYLSLDDDLMRVFGSDRISSVMQRLGMEEGQEIESKMVTKAIANAQKRVEGRNFEIRKHLLEYDDVMNSQREFIYDMRNKLLEGEDISSIVNEYITEVAESIVEFYTDGKSHPEDWDLDGLQSFMKTRYLINIDHDRIDPYKLSYNEYVNNIKEELFKTYNDKEVTVGNDAMRIAERLITLQVIDTKWREHLLTMDELRDGIWTVGYGERNPLVEYKLEGFELFRGMMDKLRQDILEFIMKVQIEEVLVEEDEDFEYTKIGEEHHAEVEQFAEQGGIPVLTAQPSQGARKEFKQNAQGERNNITSGGVKRKKTRRSRRR